MSEEQKTARVSLRRKSMSVEIEDENGSVVLYTIKELIGPERDDYISFMGDKVRMSADGKPTGIKNAKGLQSKLISASLYDANGKKVKQEEIDTWPCTAQDAVFKMAQDLSALNPADQKKVDEEVKND